MRERAGSKAGKFSSQAARAGILVALTTGLTLLWAGSAFAADNRASAQNIPIGGSTLTNNVGATEEGGEQFVCPGVNDYGLTVWNKFTIPADGTATVRATDGGEINEGQAGGPGFNDGDFDSVAVLYPSGSNSEIACNDDDPAGDGVSSKIVTHLAAGTYFVQVGGYWGALDPFPEEGFFTVSVDFAQDPPPGPPGSVNGKALGRFLPPTKSGKRRHKTRIQSLKITGEAGSTATVSCSRCRPRQAAFAIPGNGQLTVTISGLLSRGTVVEIRITKPGEIGYLKRYTTVGKSGKPPRYVECAISTTGAALC